jgi:hypothetical protein
MWMAAAFPSNLVSKRDEMAREEAVAVARIDRVFRAIDAILALVSGLEFVLLQTTDDRSTKEEDLVYTVVQVKVVKLKESKFR